MILWPLGELVALELALWRLHRKYPKNHNPLAEVHHGYAAALAFIPQPAWLATVWLLIAADDVLQHIAQYWDPTYRSPLHRLGQWVYDHSPAWLQRVLARIWQ